MNKSQFIAMVAEKAEMSRSAAARAVDAIFDTAGGAISDAVNTAGHLSIPGFGKFTSKKRAARTGRNPRTGMQIQIPERTTVSFSPGKGLKESASAGGGGARKSIATKSAGGSKTAKAAKTTSAAKTRSAATKQTRESSGAATKSTARKSTAGTGGGSTAKKSSGGSGGSTAKKSTGGATKAASKSTAKKSR